MYYKMQHIYQYTSQYFEHICIYKGFLLFQNNKEDINTMKQHMELCSDQNIYFYLWFLKKIYLFLLFYAVGHILNQPLEGASPRRLFLKVPK